MFCCNEYVKLFKKIKRDARVAIYGSSDTASAIKKELEKQRKDVQLLFFVDSFESGEFEGLPLYSLEEFEPHLSEIDTVVVSSYSNAYMIKLILNNYKIENIVYVSKKLVDEFKFKSVEIDRAKIEKVKKILKTNKDRKIYQMVANGRTDKKKHLKKIKDWAKKNIKNKIHKHGYDLRHYIEYLNKGAIKTVLDCGAHDAFHGIIFANEFKNCEKIWAFEPLYDEFKTEHFDFIMKKNGKIEIVKKALWDTKTTLDFNVRSENLAASSIVEARHNAFISKEYSVVKVETITIDDFARENKINKVDFIKMDLENSEMHALKGAEKTILRDRPQLAISIYHSVEHFLEIPVYLNNLLKDYVFRLGHYSDGFSEMVLYAIPKELA